MAGIFCPPFFYEWPTDLAVGLMVFENLQNKIMLYLRAFGKIFCLKEMIIKNPLRMGK